jgi:putative ATP-dependent endonuclease of the OLD family
MIKLLNKLKVGMIVRLLRFTIKNFRGIKDLTIDMDKIAVLTGKNNVGKSSVLKAYELFSNLDVPKLEDFYEKDCNNKIELIGEFGDFTENDLKHQALVKSIEGNRWKVKWEYIGVSKNKKDSMKKFTWKNGDWSEGGSGGIDALFASAVPEPIFIKAMDDIVEREKQIKTLVGELLKSRFNLLPEYQQIINSINGFYQKVQLETDEIKGIESDLNSLLNSIFVDIKAKMIFSKDRNKIEKSIHDNFFDGVELEDKIRTPVHYQGHGVQRSFVMSILECINNNTIKKKVAKSEGFERSKILIIEEPELFLHPSALRISRDVIYSLAESNKYQIICATHSPIFVDLSKDHTTIVRLVKGINGTEQTRVSSDLFNAEEKERMKMILRFNSYINEIFFVDRAILVEGDTEVIALSTMWDKLYKNNKLAKEHHIVNCIGKGNIPLFQKVLNHFEIPYVVWHDTDSMYSNKLKINGDKKKNPAWAHNETIHNLIQEGKNKGIDCFRYCSIKDFEENFFDSHEMNDKPLLAMKKILESTEKELNELILVCNILFGVDYLEEEHTPEYIKKKVMETEEELTLF